MKKKIQLGNEFQMRTYFGSCVVGCVRYIMEDSTSQEEIGTYMQDLTEAVSVMKSQGIRSGLLKLASSGIFNDNVGKVTEITDDYIEYTTDY